MLIQLVIYDEKAQKARKICLILRFVFGSEMAVKDRGLI